MEIVGIVATSLDGCITKHGAEGAAFTSDEDKRYFGRVLRTFDCSMMGSRTFEVDRDSILARLNNERLRTVLTSRPEEYASYARPGRLEFKSGDLAGTLDELRARGKKRCAVLGGAGVYTECIQRGLMDEWWVTLEPQGFGSGVRVFEGQVAFRFCLQSVEHLSRDTLLLKYTVL